MNGPRTARRFLIAQLVLMVVLYVGKVLLTDYVTRLGDIALGFTYAAMVLISATALFAVYMVRGLVPRPPYRPRDDRSLPGIRGTVVASTGSFEGPDGRPCVAAIRVDRTLAEQNRWIPFSLDVEGEEVCVQPADLDASIRRAHGKSWKHTAARPRYFAGGAWAPGLVDETRLDWICVRPGDYLEITRGRLRWIVGPPSEDGSDSVATATTRSTTTSPYRTASAMVIEVANDEESPDLDIEVVHPRHDLTWRRRRVLRYASLVWRAAAGTAVFAWFAFSVEQLGLFALMPWLLATLAAVVLMPVYGAYAAGSEPLTACDPTPPPWQREPANESLAERGVDQVEDEEPWGGRSTDPPL